MSRRGLVLIIVLVAVVFLSLGAYSFTDLMVAHRESADLAGRQAQTRLLVDSGVEAIRLFLQLDPDTQKEAGGVYDNPALFRGRTVIPAEDLEERGSFTLISPALDDDSQLAGIRYGLENESTRLNLNALTKLDELQPGTGRQLLMSLPSMTEDVADAILDWLDADSEARELGAEVDYYSGLSRPYTPRNGALDTVEELLLVRGVTPQLLFGQDANRNGQIDPAESAATAAKGSTFDNGLVRGWSAHLTLYSTERNTDPQGRPRINLNMNNMEELHRRLTEVFPPDWATFIVAYRQNGPATAGGQAKRGESRTPDLTKPAKTQLSQVLDLIGAKTQCRFQGDNQATVIDSPFGSELVAMAIYLDKLLDHTTINPALTIPGRININQAPATILRGIPGMTEEILSQLLARRKVVDEDEIGNRRHETWLATLGVCTLDEMRLLAPFITSGGNVHRGQVVGYFQGGTAASRAEVVFETTGPLPRVLFWRDLSHLGRGYTVETLGVDFSE